MPLKRYLFNFQLLNQLMIARGLSAADLSRAIHEFERYPSRSIISERNIQRWVSGKHPPSEGFIQRMARFFDIKPGDFYVSSIASHATIASDRFMINVLIEEARTAFRQNDHFARGLYGKLLERVTTLDPIAGYPIHRIATEVLLERSDSAFLGLVDSRDANTAFESITVTLPVTMVAAIVLFKRMQHHLEAPIHIRLTCCTGPDVNAEMHAGVPDFAVLPLGAASSAFERAAVSDYEPLMLMPSGSYAIVSNESSTHRPPQAILLVTERPSSAVPFVQDAMRRSTINNLSLVHSENADAYAALRSSGESLAAAHWFPFYVFADRAGMKTWIRNTPVDENRYVLSTFLFVRASLLRTAARRDTLTRLVRHVWLELRQRPELVEGLVLDLCTEHDSRYLRALERCSGFLDGFRDPNDAHSKGRAHHDA